MHYGVKIKLHIIQSENLTCIYIITPTLRIQFEINIKHNQVKFSYVELACKAIFKVRKLFS